MILHSLGSDLLGKLLVAAAEERQQKSKESIKADPLAPRPASSARNRAIANYV